MTTVLFRKGLVFAVIVLFIGASIVPSISGDEPVSRETIYVDDDASPGWYDAIHVKTIQEGIDNASNGDTVFVYNGTYYENVVVDKTIDLIGENKNNTKIYGLEYDTTIFIISKNVSLQEFTIIHNTSSYPCIYILKNNISLSQNIIHSENDGIRIHPFDSSTQKNITITHNTFLDGSEGINVQSGGVTNFDMFNLTISNNIFHNNSFGIWIEFPFYRECRNTTINSNIFHNCGILYIQGNDNDQGTSIINNTVNEKPLVFIENKSDIIVNYTSGQVLLSRCTNVSILNQSIQNTSAGIQLVNSDNCTIIRNQLFNNVFGLFNFQSNNNIAIDNNIKNNREGIIIYSCENNTFISNDIKNNNYQGIYSTFDNRNNLFYHNTFINNSPHVEEESDSNIWNHTYPIGGNYWDDYYGNDVDGDGIGDTPYNLSGGINQDYYPLMNPITNPPTFVWIDDDFDSSTPGWGYDHFDVIQDGIDAVDENGTVYVFNGTYFENVVVNKSINLTGEEKNSTIIQGNTTEDICTFRLAIENTRISNCTLTHDNSIYTTKASKNIKNVMDINWKSDTRYGLYEGIVIDETANNTTFSNCIIKNYTWDHAAGFWIYSNNNLISHCIFDDNPIYISDNNIGNNTVNNCLFRNMSFLFLELTQNTLIAHNEFIGGGVYILGLQPSHFFHTFQNNTVNNKSLLYLTNETGQSINDVELGQLILVNCSYFDISNVTIDHVVNGIELAYCCNVTIHSCNIEENMYGSSFYFNEDIMVKQNLVSSCQIAMTVYQSTLNLLNNTITDNADGISISDSTTTIKENNISSNNNSAIILQAMDNLISHNQIISNGGEGILILHADNNTIHNNTIKNNNNGGIAIQLPGNNNTIYHNIFCNNVPNAIDYGNNNWDDGYPSGGNYWDDYTGIDADGDGIGDTPYNISGGSNQDNYPFMHPYGWLIDIDVNQSIFNRGFPIRHALDGDWAAAQSFIPTLNMLTSTEIYMRKFGAPEFNLTVELREDHPQGILHDTLVLTPDEVSSSWDWLTLDFEDITIEPDMNLFIVCPPAPSGVTTSFGYEWGYAFGNQYDDGAFWFTRDGGGLWRDLPTMYEFVFRTYGIM